MSEKAKANTTSVNLPRTDFPMKANLSGREPETLAYWEQHQVYEHRLERNRSNEPFLLHDGPPYANGHLHIGHALNKILKDIIVKYKLMKGHYSPYVPGWDCHGLPIELQVDKELGSKKQEMTLADRRRQCREYAARFVDIQRDEFKRMGLFGNWASPYLTMSYEYEASIVREFARFVRSGHVYQGRKPVHWCPSCVTALAEAEVEYADKKSPSIYVSFPLSASEAAKLDLDSGAGGSVFMLIWTTTPWTLPANLALAVHPDIEYVAARKGEDLYIVAKARYEALAGQLAFSGTSDRGIPGSRLVGLEARHPFIERASPVLAADFVSTEDGSGIVHIAPGHGEDDYRAGLAHGLDVYAPVDDHGRFTSDYPDFEGQFVFKANEGIITMLADRNALLGRADIEHSYPHCWRCKKPVIFRATEQWFISMAHENLREKALSEIDRVHWYPPIGRNRIYSMVQNRPDWCISRQRAWGVPITLLRCRACGTYTTDPEALDGFVSLVERDGADVWFDRSPADLLPEGYTCLKCGAAEFAKETDILDVWFDSGVSHAAVLERTPGLKWPAELYLEGSDQHRGWFQSSLLASVGTRNQAPYTGVLTHGFIVDGQGRKMSKSVGNVVSPQEVIKQNGAEVLRLWVSAADYQEDVKISKEILSRLIEAYRKIRNTCRYLLGNLYDFDPAMTLDPHTLPELDRFALSRLHELIERVDSAYEGYRFHEVYHSLYNFCVVEMSAFYLDILKDRLYTFRADSPARRGSQWVLYRILKALTGMMAPILSFTAEEVQKYTPGVTDSVFMEEFPVVNPRWIDRELTATWTRIIQVRDEVNKALELRRHEKFIGNSLEARVTVHTDGETRKLLESYRDDLATIFIVSEANLADLDSAPEDAFASSESNLRIHVSRASGEKCSRCWNWRTDVAAAADGTSICGRCRQVLSG